MEGVSVFPTRLFFHLASQPEWMGTPFLRVTPTFPAHGIPAPFAPELDSCAGSLPYKLAPQMMAAEADDFLRAVDHFPDAPFLELNAGCPSPTCVGKGAGSSLLRDPEEFRAMIERLAARLGKGRLAVKMRTGFHTPAEFPALLSALADLPLARLTVHGRARTDGYRGRARLDLIRDASLATRAPVIGSGDVVDHASFAAMLAEAPGLSGVIIGRGAMRNPWIFSELRQEGEVSLPREALLYALLSFAMLCELYAERLPTLVRLTRDGVFSTVCGVDPAAWFSLAKRLMHAVYEDESGLALDGHPLPPPLSRHTLGRAKMLWNYLRSSLPGPYFEPTIMRHRELGAFLGAIRDLGAGGEALPLRHNPTWNWIYSGEKADKGLSLTSNIRVQVASQSNVMQVSIKSSPGDVQGIGAKSNISGKL